MAEHFDFEQYKKQAVEDLLSGRKEISGLDGSLATLTGIGLSVVAIFALAEWMLDVPFEPNLWPMIVVFVAITGLTVLIGMLNSREVVNKPPLEVLRKEV